MIYTPDIVRLFSVWLDLTKFKLEAINKLL